MAFRAVKASYCKEFHGRQAFLCLVVLQLSGLDHFLFQLQTFAPVGNVPLKAFIGMPFAFCWQLREAASEFLAGGGLGIQAEVSFWWKAYLVALFILLLARSPLSPTLNVALLGPSGWLCVAANFAVGDSSHGNTSRKMGVYNALLVAMQAYLSVGITLS